MTDALPIKWGIARKKPIEIHFREVIPDNKVIIQSILGKRVLSPPIGRIVPRIC